MPVTEQRLSGVCAASLTPIDDRGEPDHRALLAHCRRLLASGCDAINLLGTTGEATSFSVAQRLGVMRAVAESDLPLARFMVGTGAAAFADALALTRAAVTLGFAGALVVPPFYFKNLTDDGVFGFYDRLVEEVDDARLRLYLYHFPQNSGFAFTAPLVRRLADAHPVAIAGIKDSSGTPGFAQSIVATCPELDVFPSSEGVLGDARELGYAGCISATVNVDAPLAARVWHGARDVQPALTAIRSIVAKHQLVPAIRAVVAALRADEAWLRPLPPLAVMPAADAARLVAELDSIPAFSIVREAFDCA